MGDPLLSGGIGLEEVLIVVFKVGVAFVLLLLSVLFMDLVRAQGRGRHAQPDRAPTWPGRGASSRRWPTASSSSSRRTSARDAADRPIFRLAPYLSIIPAFLTFAIVPIGGTFTGDGDGTVSLFGRETYLQVADPPIGVLLLLAMSSIAVYGIMLAGWSSGSKYPLLGSVRASAQMVSYEAALGLSTAAVILL